MTHELDEVNRRIAEHPFASEPTRKANQLVEDLKAQNRDAEQINSALEKEGLPRLEELGKTTAKGLFGWSLLHRRKRKLERRITRTQDQT